MKRTIEVGKLSAMMRPDSTRRTAEPKIGGLPCLTNAPRNPREGALMRRDVKNEGTSGDVYENKGEATNCQAIFRAFLQKIPDFCSNKRYSNGIAGRQCTGYTEIRGESAPTFRALPEPLSVSVIGGLGHEPEIANCGNLLRPLSHDVPESKGG